MHCTSEDHEHVEVALSPSSEHQASWLKGVALAAPARWSKGTYDGRVCGSCIRVGVSRGVYSSKERKREALLTGSGSSCCLSNGIIQLIKLLLPASVDAWRHIDVHWPCRPVIDAWSRAMLRHMQTLVGWAALILIHEVVFMIVLLHGRACCSSSRLRQNTLQTWGRLGQGLGAPVPTSKKTKCTGCSFVA